MIQRQRRSLVLSLLFFLSAIAITAIEFDLLRKKEEPFLLVFLVIACCMPGLIAWFKGTFDLFEPVYPIAVATLVYFGLMVPVFILNDSFSLLGISYRNEVPEAMFLALVALAAYYVAYYGHSARTDYSDKRPEMTKPSRAYAHHWSLVMLGFFSSLFILWIVIGRVPLWSFWIFGKGYYNAWQTTASGFTIGYLFSALEALPACLLLLIATRKKHRWPLYSLLLLAFITFLFTNIGVRARVLLAVGSAAAFYYLERNKRPSAWLIGVMVFIVFFVIAGAIGYYRDPANKDPGQSEFTLTDAWGSFSASSNIVTPTAAYVHWSPMFGYDWGKTFLNLLLTPIPSSLWPDKYLFFGEPAIDEYLPYGSEAPIFVPFYASFGPVGVVVGMALFGWACRRVYNTYQVNAQDSFAQISLSLLWAYLFHMYGRHSISVVVYGLIYVFAPLWFVHWLVTRYQGRKVYSTHRGLFYER
jgi:oligosaccharide repeat unit polymerase